MRMHLGFTLIAGLAVLGATLAVPAANAQCSSGGYSGSSYRGGVYYAPATTYYAPSYSGPQYCPPPVYYRQPIYRSYSVNVGIGHGGHDRNGGRYSPRYDRHDRHDRHHDRGHRSNRRHYN
ncbi:MAG: hypothetical protein HRU75_11435 [Planctomycetia bacterium]|nr:MAG: hypothetical protein HRU75_11435 [Planctomycetia bacterium]